MRTYLFFILLIFIQCKKKTSQNPIIESFKIPEKLALNDEYNVLPDSIISNYYKTIDSTRIENFSTFLNLEIGVDSIKNNEKLKLARVNFCKYNAVSLIKNSRPFYYKLLNDEKNTYRISFTSHFNSIGTKNATALFELNDFLKEYKDCNYQKANVSEDDLQYTFNLLLKAFINRYGNYNIKIDSKFDNGNNYYWFEGQNLIQLSFFNFQSETLDSKFKDYPIYKNSVDFFDTQKTITISISNLLLEKRYENKVNLKKEQEYQNILKNESLQQQKYKSEERTKIKEIEKSF